jgi:hypothetical protein
MSVKGRNKFAGYKGEILKADKDTGGSLSNSAIARIILNSNELEEKHHQSLRKYVKTVLEGLDSDTEESAVKNEVKSETKPNDYKNKSKFVLSAWNQETGMMMDIDIYCKYYNLPRKDISSYKLVSHTGTPYYNIVFKENVGIESEVDLDVVKDFLSSEIERVYEYKFKDSIKKAEGVLKWSDLHFGALINNIMHVHDFDKDILMDGLLESVDECNALGFGKAHVHINGDLIESFSGLNHINSWMSMDKDMIGANAVKMCSKMLHTVLSRVDNLGKIKIIAGNHDRTSKANDEDVKGGAAELIAFCLELMGYDVEFHPYVITHHVDGINHINLHGDKGISKRTTDKIILDYGVQGEYNLINEGHLHSVIEKLSIKQRETFEVVKDDSILHRRFYLPSFFTGNYYSATLGFTTNPGYFIIWSNSKNKPQFFNGSV